MAGAQERFTSTPMNLPLCSFETMPAGIAGGMRPVDVGIAVVR